MMNPNDPFRRLAISYGRMKQEVGKQRKEIKKQKLATQQVQEKLDTAMKSLQLAHDRIEKLETLLGGNHE